MDIMLKNTLDLIDRNYQKDEEFESAFGLARSTVSAWRRGKLKSYTKYLAQIASFFNVSIDWLSGNDQKEKPTLTKKDELDIKTKIDDLLSMMSNQEGLMFDGDPLTPEALESIKNAMELGMTAAKLKNKQKYGHHNKKASANGRAETGKKTD